MYVAGAAVVTSPEVGVNCCQTSFDDVTGATPKAAAGFEQSGGGAAAALLVGHVAAFALSLTGNAIVLYVIGRHLGYGTATNVFIASLCVTDVATAVVSLLLAGASVARSQWSLGGQMTCVAYDVVRLYDVVRVLRHRATGRRGDETTSCIAYDVVRLLGRHALLTTSCDAR